MTAIRSRVTALQAIVAGSPLPLNDARTVIREFQEVLDADRVRRVPRRLLLQVLHSTRALDTGLSALLTAGGVIPSTSLGRMLRQLESPGLHGNQLPAGTAAYYQACIVNSRNRYMHEAGTFPSVAMEILTLLSDMDACLTQAYRLW